MGTIADYFKWRGDLSFEQDEFNDIDNLVFSCISYIEFCEAFKAADKDCLTVSELNELYWSTLSERSRFDDNSFLKSTTDVLGMAAKCNRFKDILVRNYVSRINPEKNLQFAAMEFVVSYELSYVAFRGTDDTITGWKEDFMMSLFETESEKEAARYIDEIKGGRFKKIIVGGHSKGGHLAVYAAGMCDPKFQKKIIKVYSNDGPGFMPGLVDREEFKAVEDKIVRILPEESVVGMLMQNIGKVKVVASTNKLIMQHDLQSWCLEGKSLMTLEGISKNAQQMDKLLSDWISSFDDVGKERFIYDLFSVLECTGVERVTEIQNDKHIYLPIIRKHMNALPEETKEKIREVIKRTIRVNLSR